MPVNAVITQKDLVAWRDCAQTVYTDCMTAQYTPCDHAHALAAYMSNLHLLLLVSLRMHASHLTTCNSGTRSSPYMHAPAPRCKHWSATELRSFTEQVRAHTRYASAAIALNVSETRTPRARCTPLCQASVWAAGMPCCQSYLAAPCIMIRSPAAMSTCTMAACAAYVSEGLSVVGWVVANATWQATCASRCGCADYMPQAHTS